MSTSGRARGWVLMLGALCALSTVSASGRAEGALTAARPWPQRNVARIPGGPDAYPVGGILAASGGAAVIEDADVGLNAFARLYRVDLSRGTTQRGSLVFQSVPLVRVGSALAVVQARTALVLPSGDLAPGSGGRGREIRLLRPSSAVVAPATDLPRDVSAAPVSPSAGAVWVGRTGGVALIALPGGRVLRSIPLPDASGRYSVSVSGNQLVAMANASGLRPIELFAVSLRTDTVVGARRLAGVGGSATAVPGGVWVSYRTGMLGTAELLSFPRLARLSPNPPPPGPNGSAPLPGSAQAMGIEVSVDGPVTYLVDSAGVACVATASGQVRAEGALESQQSFAPIGAAHGALYGLVGHALVAVEAPPACGVPRSSATTGPRPARQSAPTARRAAI